MKSFPLIALFAVAAVSALPQSSESEKDNVTFSPGTGQPYTADGRRSTCSCTFECESMVEEIMIKAIEEEGNEKAPWYLRWMGGWKLPLDQHPELSDKQREACMKNAKPDAATRTCSFDFQMQFSHGKEQLKFSKKCGDTENVRE